MGAALGVHADTKEIRQIYESSTVLPLIGGEYKEKVIANSRLRRADERRPLKPTQANVLLIVDGCIDVFQGNAKTHTILATRTLTAAPPVESSIQTAARRARYDVNGNESVWDDEAGAVQSAEVLVYWRDDHDLVCRYSCPNSGGDEVVLKSATGDRIELRNGTRYLTIALRSIAVKGASSANLHGAAGGGGTNGGGLQSINALTNADLVELVGSIPFFAGIPRDKLVALTDVSTIRVYPPRSVIFREDEGMSTQMYVTLAGALEVSSSRAAAPLATLEPGSFFGEMSLLINIPRAATVTSVESCLLMSIEKEAFHAFLEKLPEVKESVYRLLKERLVSKAIMSGVLPYMKTVPPARLLAFSHDLTIEDHVRKNDVVLDQDGTSDNANKFVIVVYGVLEIVSGEPRRTGKRAHTAFLTPGCYFGPFSFERLKFQHGKVMARSPVVIMSCPFAKMQTLFHEFPEVAAEANIAWYGERCDLATVLRHAILTQRFQNFLEAEHSDENFKFCLDVQKFRDSPREERHGMATYIVNRYIMADSPKEVNLPASIRDHVIQSLKKIPATEDVATTFFDSANDEIMKLMTKDSFPRFKKSPMFQAVLDALDPHINRKGSKLLDACHAFRESINVIKPGKVEHVAVAKMQRMLSTIRKSQERQQHLGHSASSAADLARIRADNASGTA